MASEEAVAPRPAEQVPGVKEVGADGVADGMAEAERGMQELGISGEEDFPLHRACAEGRIDGVREILSASLEALETLDTTTGCTPIVLAIRNNHYDVVRELLQAGAIVPPPGVTNDQQMLSILYPQHLYGMSMGHFQPPPQHHQLQQHPDYYGQAPAHFYSHPAGMHMSYPPHRGRKESDLGQRGEGQPNLPPVDVAKTIPCRNFPNCKYGNNCAFFHPAPNRFFGQQPVGYGYETGFQGGFQPGMGMGYQQAAFQQHPQHHAQFASASHHDQQFQPPSSQQTLESSLASLPEQAPAPDIPGSELESLEVSSTANNAFEGREAELQTSQAASLQTLTSDHAAFVPAFQPQSQPPAPMSPSQPSQFGASPISPSMLGASLPTIPPAEQFFAAASPPSAAVFTAAQAQTFAPMQMMPAPHARRQSFTQFGIPVIGPNGVPGIPKPFGHSKKASFSGGPRPFAGARPAGLELGKWKDGLPPPCAFYVQGKCRNGEMCKFPHMDAEGNDCRHPDVVRGLIAPIPSMGRPPRPPRQFGTFDPMFRQQQLVYLHQQRVAAQQVQPATSKPNGSSTPASDVVADASMPVLLDGEAAAPVVDSTQQTPSHPTLPPKPVGATANTPATNVNASTLAPVPVLVRSASQPGVQRVHANGFSSRSQSPAPSNVSFHGNGHPRRTASRPPFAPAVNGHAHAHMNGNGNGHAGRSGSVGPRQPAVTGPAKRNQRVPNADEFPALGGSGVESKQTSPVARGRTAAEVLSAPAPEKPVVKVTREDSVDSKSSDESITMDSDNESDGVIISCKPSNSSASTPAQSGNASPAKRPSVSFASMASSIAATPSTDNAPVAIKA